MAKSRIVFHGNSINTNVFIKSLMAFYPCSENRYLLFLTENYAALEVLKHYIHEPQPIPEPTSGVFPSQSEASGTPSIHLQQEVEPWDMDPFVLFGSSFPKDTEYTQVRIRPVARGGLGGSIEPPK